LITTYKINGAATVTAKVHQPDHELGTGIIMECFDDKGALTTVIEIYMDRDSGASLEHITRVADALTLLGE
jgi:hypothetical protein